VRKNLQCRQTSGFKVAILKEMRRDKNRWMVPETGIEPVRPLSGKRRILSPLCLPISPLGLDAINDIAEVKKARRALF
jgi:hypothetical protein